MTGGKTNHVKSAHGNSYTPAELAELHRKLRSLLRDPFLPKQEVARIAGCTDRTVTRMVNRIKREQR